MIFGLLLLVLLVLPVDDDVAAAAVVVVGAADGVVADGDDYIEVGNIVGLFQARYWIEGCC